MGVLETEWRERETECAARVAVRDGELARLEAAARQASRSHSEPKVIAERSTTCSHVTGMKEPAHGSKWSRRNTCEVRF